MNTLIKGTFPVRFRRDGKDGVNVWLKYASVLDLTDSNTGKSYPSKIFNEPTAECKYIGIGKGVGDEPTQGQYYDWKKYVGDDGTSFTPKGRAIAHYTTLTAYNSASKSVGLYLVDNTGGALLKYWNGSASGDRSVIDGDAYTTADKHLWVKDGVKWHDLGEIQGPKGDPGDDAYSYKLRSNITAIPLDNNGMPVDSAKSLTLTGNIFKGSSSISVSTSYTIRAIITWNGTASDTKTSSNGSLTVDLSTYKNIVKVACSFLYGNTVLDSFDILPIKAGAAGVSYFPNMRGLWQPNANPPYSWKDGSRDMVVYNKDGTAYLFAVKTAGATNITSSPMTEAGVVNTNDWVQSDAPFSMLFGNFVYTDNASVGGFVFSEEQMRSTSTTDGNNPKSDGSNCNILINGNTGKFVANYATIRGEVNAKKGFFENCVIGNGCTIKNDNGWNLIGDSTGRGWKLDGVGTMTVEFHLRYRNGSGGDINKLYLNNGADAQYMFQLNTQTADGINIYTPNNTAIYVSSGESIFNDIVTMKGSKTSVKGLHVSTYSMSSTGTIPATYDVVTFNNTSAITATLPSASSYNGKVLFLKKLGSGSVTLRGTIIPANGTGSTTTTDSVGANKSMMYISNGSAWIEFYCG